MTSKERFKMAFEHKEADRVPMWDFPWDGALRRWRSEGMPEDVSYEDYFGVDHVSRVIPDVSPRFPTETLCEDENSVTVRTQWGCVCRNFKHTDSTPEFLDYSIVDWDSWNKAKERIAPEPDRIQWAHLKANYKKWQKEGHWLLGDVFFAFNQLTSYVVGMERFLIYMAENPEFCKDMLEHCLKVNLQLLDMAWDKGYTFDMLNIRDDMGYKFASFFSAGMYREIIKPTHQMAVDWAKNKNIKVRLHSCGYIMELLPEILSVGFDAYHPIENKAGMDPLLLKKQYGGKLVLHGGFDALKWTNWDVISKEITEKLPVLMKNGGYIFAADHSLPANISFDNLKQIINLAKKVGSY